MTGPDGTTGPDGMTGSDGRGGPAAGCLQLSPDLVAGYASGALPPAAAWSVEAHVPACATCRSALAKSLDGGRLDRNRAILLARLALPGSGPGSGPLGRTLRWCRVPDHVAALLSATPSLRRSWLAGIALVLAAAIGAAHLITPAHTAAQQFAVGGSATSWVRLVPFLLLAPLVPLVSVAAAFSVRLDPAYELAVAAPVSAVWLLCVRALAVVGVTLVPTVLAALALPGPWWLPATLLLPGLAVSAIALAAATVIGPVAGAAGAGAAWVAAVAAPAVAMNDPAQALGPAGQVCAAAVLIGAVALLAGRRERIELGWARGADR